MTSAVEPTRAPQWLRGEHQARLRDLSAVRPGASDDRWVAQDVLRRGYRLEQQRRGLMPSTITKRQQELNRLERFLGAVTLCEATQDDLERFLDERRLGDIATNGMLACLMTFYGYAIRQGAVDRNPAADIVRPRLRRRVPRPIDREDLAYAIEQADTVVLQLWLCLAALQGLRCCEIAGLRREDVMDRRADPLLVVVKGKGGHQRIMGMHPEVLELFRRLGPDVPAQGPLWVGWWTQDSRLRKSSKPVAASYVSHRIGDHFRRLSINASAHQLRHFFATEIYAATHDLRVVQELLGHANPSTTAGYAAFSAVDATAAIRGLTYRREEPSADE